MSVVRRWNSKPFSDAHVEKVHEVVGVYLLVTRSGYVNYVGMASNLRQRLLRHLRDGDIPAEQFTAFQTESREAARRLKCQYIEQHEPYYNIAGCG